MLDPGEEDRAPRRQGGRRHRAYEFDPRALAQRPGRVLSREQLLDLAKGSAELSFDRSIDVHVSRLRHKLGDDLKRPELIKTVRGAGYVLAADDDDGR